MPKQDGNGNGKSLLRQATFGSFIWCSLVTKYLILRPSPAAPAGGDNCSPLPAPTTDYTAPPQAAKYCDAVLMSREYRRLDCTIEQLSSALDSKRHELHTHFNIVHSCIRGNCFTASLTSHTVPAKHRRYWQQGTRTDWHQAWPQTEKRCSVL